MDPRIQDITFEQAELSLLFLENEELDLFERLEEMLGILWTREDVESMFSTGGEGKASKISKLKYPLALVLQPELRNQLGRQFGLYEDEDPSIPNIPKNATSLSTLSKEDFLAKLGFQAQGTEFEGKSSMKEPSKGLQPGPRRTLGGRKL